jgi:hypothetical protein
MTAGSLVGCSGDPARTPATLRFKVTGGLPGNPPPPAVDVTLTDAVKTQDVYTATATLPELPAGAFSCPNDWGVLYQIEFFDELGTVAKATLDPSGCREVTLTDNPTRRVLDDGYWSRLAGDLGIDESKIYPLNVTP